MPLPPLKAPPMKQVSAQMTPQVAKPPTPSGMTVGTRGPTGGARHFDRANQMARVMALRRRGGQQEGQVRSALMPQPDPVYGLG